MEKVKSTLDPEPASEVEHYLDHGEYEIGVEGLFLEIMKLKGKPPIDLQKSMEIAKLLKLNEESIFDDDFWKKFKVYVAKSTNM